MDKICSFCKSWGRADFLNVSRCGATISAWTAGNMSCPYFAPKPPEIPAALREWKPVWKTGKLPSAAFSTLCRFLVLLKSGFYDVVWSKGDGDGMGAWTCALIKTEDIIAWAELPQRV